MISDVGRVRVKLVLRLRAEGSPSEAQDLGLVLAMLTTRPAIAIGTPWTTPTVTAWLSNSRSIIASERQLWVEDSILSTCASAFSGTEHPCPSAVFSVERAMHLAHKANCIHRLCIPRLHTAQEPCLDAVWSFLRAGEHPSLREVPGGVLRPEG